MSKILIFLTERYPNEYIGSIYEQNEVLNLEPDFSTIYILSQSTKKTVDPNFSVPNNTFFERINIKSSFISRLFSLKYLFTLHFFKEIINLNKKLKIKINFRILKIILIELQKSHELKNQIIGILKKNKLDPSNVLVYSFWNDYRAFAACLVKEKQGDIKVISRCHGGDVYYERHPFNYLPFKNSMLNLIDGIYPISLKSERYLKEKLNAKDKIKYFHLGVENKTKFFNSNLDSKIRIVSCSHIVPIKRVELIIEILSQIKDIQFEWVHIGGNYLTKDIEGICKKSFVFNNQSFVLKGSLSNEEIMHFYTNNTIDLFINLSSSEGVPVSIMEAMSFGIPSIATNVGSTSEIVINGKSGFLVSENPSYKEVLSIIQSYSNLSLVEKQKLRNDTYDFWNNNFNASKNYELFRKEVLKKFSN